MQASSSSSDIHQQPPSSSPPPPPPPPSHPSTPSIRSRRRLPWNTPQLHHHPPNTIGASSSSLQTFPTYLHSPPLNKSTSTSTTTPNKLDPASPSNSNSNSNTNHSLYKHRRTQSAPITTTTTTSLLHFSKHPHPAYLHFQNVKHSPSSSVTPPSLELQRNTPISKLHTSTVITTPLNEPFLNSSKKGSKDSPNTLTSCPFEHATWVSKDLKQPGGFRRYHVLQHYSPKGQMKPSTHVLPPSFYDLIQLYGHFAGDTLWNEEEMISNDPSSSETYPYPYYSQEKKKEKRKKKKDIKKKEEEEQEQEEQKSELTQEVIPLSPSSPHLHPMDKFFVDFKKEEEKEELKTKKRKSSTLHKTRTLGTPWDGDPLSTQGLPSSSSNPSPWTPRYLETTHLDEEDAHVPLLLHYSSSTTTSSSPTASLHTSVETAPSSFEKEEEEEESKEDVEDTVSPRTLDPSPLSTPPLPSLRATASNRKVFFLLLKSFIGTGVLFLPSAFRDGGFLFSFFFLIFIAILSGYGMVLLVEVNQKIPGSFGDMARHLYGPGFQKIVKWSIGLSQLGFCMAYMVFVTQNALHLLQPSIPPPSSLQLSSLKTTSDLTSTTNVLSPPSLRLSSFPSLFSSHAQSLRTSEYEQMETWEQGERKKKEEKGDEGGGGWWSRGPPFGDFLPWFMDPTFWITLQCLLYIPLTWVRHLKYFAPLSILADVFILTGLCVVMYTACSHVYTEGISNSVVWTWQPTTLPFYIGTSVYTFEGVGLLLPISQAMRHPHQFASTLSWTMGLTTCIYLGVATMGYLAYGQHVPTIVFHAFPPTSTFHRWIQVLYLLALMCTWPLLVFPVIRMIEHHYLPSANGKVNPIHKWQKNLLRTWLVFFMGVLAYLGSHHLHALVAMLGAVACIPLSFIYPPLLHLKAFPPPTSSSSCLPSSSSVWKNRALIGFGVMAMGYVLVHFF
ncbi:neutral amino acid transporter [Coelomomyces lativittatus]|nr:neutral amino acid transporter [Coelomomyces lativittatus]KAJ1511192.1 neutral amino acid transporter [Coelomomyces lativittatus]KAJ1514812.1 neutral amino acid transporter [Coelomomyces lativittatus]